MSALWTTVLCLQVLVPASSEPTRLVAVFFVNEQAKGDVFAVLDGGDVWVPLTAMSNAGLVEFTGEQREWFGAAHVSLRSLAPALTYALDPIALVLRLTASPTLFAPTNVVLQAARPPQLEYLRAPGLFVNYGATVQKDAPTAVALEAGLSLAGALLTSSATRTGDREIQRGLTSLTIDSRQHVRRIIVGDTFAPRALLGSSPLVGGISIRSRFSIDPYEVQFPLPAVQGTVTTPAVAEVYVNGNLVGREDLPPGAFQLERLPARTGLGDVRVVVRDLFGTEQEFGGPYYITSNVLRPGVSDYHYLVGVARSDGFDRSPTYGTTTWSMAHRIGVTRWLTLGMRSEGSRRVADLGPTLNLRLWRFGEITAAGAASHSQRRTDVAFAGSYSLIASPVTATLSGLRVGPHYSSLSLGVNDPRQRDRFDASVGVSLGRGASVLVARSYVAGVPETVPDARAREQYVELDESVALLPITSFSAAVRVRDSAALNVRLGGRTRLTFSVTRTALSNQSRPAFQGYVSLGVIMTRRSVATVTHARTEETESTVVDLQRSLPLGSGVGYRFLGDTANQGAMNGLLQAQGRYGRVNLRQNYLNGRQTSTMDVSGGVVWTGGEINLSRRIHDGYALVRVPEVPGIRVYLNDQVVGHTSRRGSVLVPNLLSYLGNPIRIADEDVPLEFELSRLRALVAPTWRGGGVVTFPARPLRSVTGRLRLARGGTDIVPAFGRLAVIVEGAEQSSPVGTDGEFFLEQVPPGEHQARLVFEGATCLLTLAVPTVSTLITDIGVTRCVSSEEGPR